MADVTELLMELHRLPAKVGLVLNAELEAGYEVRTLTWLGSSQERSSWSSICSASCLGSVLGYPIDCHFRRGWSLLVLRLQGLFLEATLRAFQTGRVSGCPDLP